MKTKKEAATKAAQTDFELKTKELKEQMESLSKMKRDLSKMKAEEAKR